MRKYNANGQLKTMLCNSCGKKMVVQEGIVREGAVSFNHAWDYFSEKDGEVHHWDLCEECYDDLIRQFRLEVTIEELTELI